MMKHVRASKVWTKKHLQFISRIGVLQDKESGMTQTPRKSWTGIIKRVYVPRRGG